MGKDAYYFPHDCNARNDPKIAMLRRQFGFLGYALYFCVVEVLREQVGYCYPISTLLGLPFAIGIDPNDPEVENCPFEGFLDYCIEVDLFQKDDKWLTCKSLTERMQPLEKSRLAGKKGAEVRWGTNTTLMVAQCTPNSIKVKESKEEVYKGDFEAVWAKYPSKVGKSDALRHFNASIKSEVDFTLINKALQNYLLSKRVKDGFVQNGSTWFNDWRGWLEVKEEPKVHQQKL